MRALKIAGIAIACLVVLAVIAAVTVVLRVNPNDYRGDIERLVQQKTGRPLTIGGKLDLKLFPYLAISIADVRLGNPPGYGNTPFVTVRQASVGVKLLPILRKRLEVSRVSIDGLAANLVSRSPTENNWKDLSSGKAAGQPAHSGGASETSIAGVDVRNASLVYRDEAARSVTSLSNLQVHTGALGGNAAVPVTMAFDYGSGGSRPLAHVAIDTSARMPTDSSQVALKDLDIHGQWFGSSPQGPNGLPFSVRSPTVVLDTRAETLSPSTFDAKLGALVAQISVSGQKVLSDRTLSGRLSVPRVSARSVLKSLAIAVPATRDPQALSSLSLSGDYQVTPRKASLTKLDLALDDTHITGSAGIDNLDTMALGFDLKVDRINVDRYLSPKSAAAGAKGSSAPTTTRVHNASAPATPLPVEALRKLRANGVLQLGSAVVSGLTFSQVSLPLTAQAGRIHLGPTRAQLAGGGCDGDIVLDASPALAHLSLTEHVKAVDAGQLMKALSDTSRISGRADANVAVTGVGNTGSAILRSLSGKVDFDVQHGAIKGVDLLYALQSAQALLKRSLPPAHPGPQQTDFNTFSGSATLDKGVVHNDDLNIGTDNLKAHGKGTVDLGTKAIDYRLVASIYKVPPQGAGSELADLKAADVPLQLTGTLDDVKVRPDIEALAKTRLRQEVTKKLGSPEVQKKLGEKLKGLFGH